MDDVNNGERHYQIVFFDLLYLNGETLIQKPYSERREKLREVIRPIPDYADIGESHAIRLKESDQIATTKLRDLFVEVCSRPAEGLVVKGAQGTYVPGLEATWFKLKKDYIDGFADTAEFALLGGSYSNEASKYLRLSRNDEPSLLNTFYVGCRTNANHSDSSASFVILFDLVAGFSREELLQISKATLPLRRKAISKLSYRVEKGPVPENAVEWYFDPPLAVEIMGGGFDKKFGFWYMRGPRLLRQSPEERSWRDTLTYEEFEKIAKSAVKETKFGDHNVRRLSAIDDKILSGTRGALPIFDEVGARYGQTNTISFTRERCRFRQAIVMTTASLVIHLDLMGVMVEVVLLFG
ncbi:hypothetical protein BC829DRAFT_264713 [Chytridium lagenaria]|nr:hypothetical protein BC829DRAFT_264713 [Chytridium lagenaria]